MISPFQNKRKLPYFYALLKQRSHVQSSLVMYPIYEFGSEDQRMKYLQRLASGEWIGAFGLTEPNHGSDPGTMKTYFEDKGNYYLLNGSKMWITNAPVCDVAVVWAKDETGKVKGSYLGLYLLLGNGIIKAGNGCLNCTPNNHTLKTTKQT